VIAPIQEKEEHSRSHRLRRARNYVASTFFGRQSYPADNAPAVPSWQAWLFTAWAVLVAAVCLGWMVGLF